MFKRIVFLTLLTLVVQVAQDVAAQEPVSWGDGADPYFSTFSIAGIDPETGESGVAVTTRVACVGNGVPWVRAGVGAVATQASTRTEYGYELLSLIEGGLSADEALSRRVVADSLSHRRQIGVISLDGTRAQHTGSGTSDWAGQREGTNYVTQGNTLVGPEVLEAVARSFQSTEGSGRHLSDRLIAALGAGQAAGGDRRDGRLQSAAVIVADPRPGNSRRQDGVTAHINVCEHPTPVAELRRIWDSITQTLGFRELRRFTGNDVWQLRVLLHASGYYRPEVAEIPRDGASQVYSEDVVEAVQAFRVAEGLWTANSSAPRALVDGATVERLWRSVEAAGKTAEVRRIIKNATLIRR